MSNIDDAAAAEFDAERGRIEYSPAQPEGASRIDDDAGPDREPDAAPEHVKPDHGGRMTH
jgi:hypothetical protein